MSRSRTGALALALLLVAVFAPSPAETPRLVRTAQAPVAPVSGNQAAAARSSSVDVPVARATVEASAPQAPTRQVARLQPRAEPARPTQAADLSASDLGPEPPKGADPIDGEVGAAPQFDIVRVEPTGDMVVAGRSRPGSDVQLLDAGKVVAGTKTDTSGNFVLLPPSLKPGSYDLSLQSRSAGEKVARSKQFVAVLVPPTRAGSVVVALAEPGKPSKLLSSPPATPFAASRPQVTATSKPEKPAIQPSRSPSSPAQERDNAVIRSVELENGTGFHASGKSTPGTRAEIYLNNSRLASVIAGKDGHWSVTVHKGLTAGRYAVRADALGREGKVVARAEVPFDVPVVPVVPAAPEVPTATDVPAMSVASSVASDRPGDNQYASAASNDAVIAAVETALVVPGDNLWNISRSRLGQGHRYTQIYASNVSQIRDPKLIYPGQVFVMPNGN